MPRPFKNRFIAGSPRSVVYKPAGIPARSLEWVTLWLDEFETIRLLDYQGLSQEQVAERMGISRPTVTRIYSGARKKIAQALTEGMAICIEGGPVEGPDSSQSPQLPGKGRRRGRKGCGRGRGRQN